MPTGENRRRAAPRANLSEPVLVRPCDPQYPEEICKTMNVSRGGLYCVTCSPHYFVGMNVVIARNFRPDEPLHREQIGDVVRVEHLEQDRWGVAIRIVLHSNPGTYAGT